MSPLSSSRRHCRCSRPCNPPRRSDPNAFLYIPVRFHVNDSLLKLSRSLWRCCAHQRRLWANAPPVSMNSAATSRFVTRNFSMIPPTRASFERYPVYSLTSTGIYKKPGQDPSRPTLSTLKAYRIKTAFWARDRTAPLYRPGFTNGLLSGTTNMAITAMTPG